MTEENLNPPAEEQTSPPPADEPAQEDDGKDTFEDLGLGPQVLAAITEMGFTEPMEVQTATVGLIREGRDLMVQSRTGSGKTAAFAIPLVDWIVNPDDLFVQAIVLLPTRELALQVAAETARIAAHTERLVVVPVYGGAPMGRQIEQLKAGGQIVCGTPGRVLDHIRRGTLKLDRVKCVVLDECDEMLSMGFQEDIEAILERTPNERQTLLFSATVPEGIQRLSRRFLHDPEMVKLSADFIGVHEIRHVYYSIPGGQREAELVRVVAFENPERAIIFCNTRDETGRLAEYLRKQGYDAEAISSDLSQADRERVMARMRAGNIRFLVATDVAARGIDLENLPCVINYTINESPEVYIHRTGRTGRAGRHGVAISLIGPAEVGSFYYIKLLYKIKPEERSLPSEAEIRSKREGERILQLRTLLPEEPSALWRSLARRVMGAPDGERMVATLLVETLERAGAPSRPREVEPVAPVLSEPPPRRVERDDRDRPPPRTAEGDDRGRRRDEGRRRPPREGADRPRDRDRPAADRPPRREEERTERNGRGGASYARGPRVRGGGGAGGPAGGGGGAGRPPRTGGSGDAPREFWEVWSEEVGRTPPTAEGAPGEPATPGEPAAPAAPGAPAPMSAPPSFESAPPTMGPGPGQARLYLNLGRKDGASEADVATLLASEGITLPPGDIDVMNTHTYLNVPAGDADRLCAAVAGKEHNGRALVCEPARPPKSRR